MNTPAFVLALAFCCVACAEPLDSIAAYNTAIAEVQAGSLERAARMLDELLASSDTRTRPGILNDLGYIRRTEGRLDEADLLYSKALDAATEAFGSAHPYCATILNNRGQVAYARR